MLAALRPLRVPSCSRSYAISVAEPKVFPQKQLPRKFSPTKTFHYNNCMRLLESSTGSPLIFLQHNDFTAQRMIKLRRDITDAARLVAKRQRTQLGSSEPEVPAPDPFLRVIRTGIFGAALRDYPGVDLQDAGRMAETMSGPVAVLSMPLFNPPQMDAILRIMDRTVPPRPAKTPEQIQKELDAKNADPLTPGRKMKKVKQVLDPELKVIGAFIEGRVFLPDKVKEVSQLPTLDTLRAQIVGLLSAPASQLVAVLGEASGGKLARTLEGLKKSMEEGSAESSAPPS